MTVVEREAENAAGDLDLELANLSDRVARSVVQVRSGQGSGSGVVWNRPGLVITNYHVVPGPGAELLLKNGTRLRARTIARDERLDLAALEVDAEAWRQLPPAEIGDSRQLRPGELVLAVGNPLGEVNAVTLGVISGLGRGPWSGGQGDSLRMAITLRPGNSGGALADAGGRIVGIPHVVTGRGIGLAVPSHVVEAFLDRRPADQAPPASSIVWV